ncbi:hypothetical protein [Falsiruegeria mediterranea]|uniref:hypothetical protein n=1 Tax=Falsiruegeria mediterranea TaxID=1280832 RepID=UPI0015F26DEF|nr:hypothetical protein [Falsiruegeria mediterranea]
MHFLFGAQLSEAIIESAARCSNACLVSGFIKSDFLQRLNIGQNCKVEVFSRWRLSDLVSGASDLQAFEEVANRGGRFFINPKLHAKVFVFDDTVFCGSANLTASGLPRSDIAGNIEAGVVMPMSRGVADLISTLRHDSLLLSKDIFEQIKNEVSQCEAEAETYSNEGHSRMPSAFENAVLLKSERTLTGYELPWTESPGDLLLGESALSEVVHDLELFYLKKGPSRASIASAFLHSRCHSWLVRNTQEPISFGGLTAKLHADLRGDPLPYRSQIKNLLRNLLTWAVECDSDYFHQTYHRRTTSYQSSRKV